MLTFLGIESSCDDSAAAVVRHHDGAAPEVLASVVQGQTALHAAFGGVVPEIAARAHAERLDGCVDQALAQAGVTLADPLVVLGNGKRPRRGAVTEREQ